MGEAWKHPRSRCLQPLGEHLARLETLDSTTLRDSLTYRRRDSTYPRGSELAVRSGSQRSPATIDNPTHPIRPPTCPRTYQPEISNENHHTQIHVDPAGGGRVPLNPMPLYPCIHAQSSSSMFSPKDLDCPSDVSEPCNVAALVLRSWKRLDSPGRDDRAERIVGQQARYISSIWWRRGLQGSALCALAGKRPSFKCTVQ
nr:hypothetical protein CFP56_22280 [Quercus suber]